MEKLIAFPIDVAFFGSDGHFLSELTDVGDLASILLNNAIAIAGIVLIFIVIIAGIQMISASGDPQKAARARQMLTAGIIGFVLVLAAYFIVRLIELSFDVTILG
jgi:hypothetical protein